MKAFKNILVVNWNVQQNDALEQAMLLTEDGNAALTVVEVVESLDDMPRGHFDHLNPYNLNNLTGHDSNQQRRESLQKIQNLGLDTECRYMAGVSHQKILDEVKQHNHDLVIAGVGNPHDFIGPGPGTLMNLVRRSAVPVWIVKPKNGKRTGRIVAAVDPAPGPGPFADPGNTLNIQIMDTANSLAEINNREIDVVHCWLQPMEDRLRQPSAKTSIDIRKVLGSTRRRHKKWLKILLDKTMSETITYRTHLLKGKPHKMIPDFARKHQIDLVILGNVSRAGIDGLFVGNTAEKILCQGNLSLLVIKPIDFFESNELLLFPSEAACEL